MAFKGRFHIPSAKEMEEPVGPPAVKSVFQNRKTFISGDGSVNNGSATGCSVTHSSVNKGSDPVLISDKSGCTGAGISTSGVDRSKTIQSATTQQGQGPLPAAGQKRSENSTVTDSPKKSGAAGEPLAQNSPVKPGKTNSIIVSARQRGNPILKYVRNMPWEFGDIVPDYQLGQTSCALYLSLRYHQLNPNYIHERLRQLGHSFDLRVLLVHVDISDPHPYLKDLAKMCILADCTLMLAFTPEEAGRYLETYKAFESKPPDLIMERTEGNLMARLTDTLTKVRRVNKTDVMTLMSAFGSFADIVKASEEDISLCPGFGPQKAKRLYNMFQEPFVKVKRKGAEPEVTPSPSPSTSPSKKKTKISH